MSKSILNKVLIVSLLLIWSVVGYKLISNFFGKNEVKSISSMDDAKYVNIKIKKKEVIDLPTILRDPFLGNYTLPKKETATKQHIQKGLKKYNTPWPQIQYYGFVKGENNNNPLVLLRVNNNLERIRKGNKIDGLLIKEIYKDSILVVFENEKRIFAKE